MMIFKERDRVIPMMDIWKRNPYYKEQPDNPPTYQVVTIYKSQTCRYLCWNDRFGYQYFGIGELLKAPT